MPLVFRCCIAALVAVLAGGAAADPADPLDEVSEKLRAEPFEVTADKLEYDLERELYVGRGNVVIQQAGRTLRADWVSFSKKSGEGVASGNVELVDAGDVVRADFVQFEIDTLEGVIYGGRFESDRSPFRASAAEIAKTGERTYRFRDGEFTTCRCPDPQDEDPWVLHAEEADLEVEGYATARNTTIDLFGVPVAWIPWMIFPVKTERQTGLLFPELSFGSFKGLRVGLPFFWAIREELGLVLTPRYSVRRGLGGTALFEYAAGEKSQGELLGAFYRDQDIDAKTAKEPFGRNRWSASGAHDLFLPQQLRFQTDFRFASDNEVPFDFDELSFHRFDRFLESQATLSRASGPLGRLGTSAGATLVDDLQNPDDLDRDRFLLQRWPSAHVDLLPGGVAGLPLLVPSFEVDYAWFQARAGARSELPGALVGPHDLFLDTGVDGLPDAAPGIPSQSEPGPLADPHGDDFAGTGGTEGDGRFEEGEPLVDRGHRLLLQPRVALPLEWYGLSLVPEVGWHETLYETHRRDYRDRGFLTTRVDLSTRLWRHFGDIVHVLEPRAGYALATSGSQSHNALFVPATAVPQDRLRALDLDAVTRDAADRIARSNRVTLGFDNHLYASGESHALLTDVRVLGLWDFEEDTLDSLLLDGRAFPFQQLDLRFHADLDPDPGRFDEALAEVRWAHPAGLALNTGYRWAREVPLFFEDFVGGGDRFEESQDLEHIHQMRAGVSLDLTARWAVRYGMAYSIEGQRVLANQALVEYTSLCGCWALGVELSQDRTQGVDAKLVYRVLGFGGEPTRTRGLLDGFGGLW